MNTNSIWYLFYKMREGLSRNKINNDLRSGVFVFEKAYISRPDNYIKGTPETSVRQQNVAVGIEPREVAEGLNGDDRAGGGFFFGYSLLNEDFQRFPGATAEGSK